MIIILTRRALAAALVLFFGLATVAGAYTNVQLRGDDNIKDIVWAIETSEKVIALTFDDGPDPKYTPMVLDILKKNNAKGTFFTVGEQVDKYPEVAKMIVRQGHEIANHTYSHPSLARIKIKELENELKKADEAIIKNTNNKPCLFRPPGGYYNEKIVDLLKAKGYTIVLWSWTQDTRDWSNPGADSIINKVINNAENGDIVIFHDCGGNRMQTINALQPVIDGLKEKGFKMITVSQLLTKGERTHRVTSWDLFE